jgi:hypothetical protein
VLQLASVTGNVSLGTDLLPDLVKNYELWVTEHLDTVNGLFQTIDDRDAMEWSAGGVLAVAAGEKIGGVFDIVGLPTVQCYRATINSYMFAEANAIAKIAKRSGEAGIATRFAEEAERVRERLHSQLWDPADRFHRVAPGVKNASDKLQLVKVREEHGYTPWYSCVERVGGENR